VYVFTKRKFLENSFRRSFPVPLTSHRRFMRANYKVTSPIKIYTYLERQREGVSLRLLNLGLFEIDTAPLSVRLANGYNGVSVLGSQDFQGEAIGAILLSSRCLFADPDSAISRRDCSAFCTYRPSIRVIGRCQSCKRFKGPAFRKESVCLCFEEDLETPMQSTSLFQFDFLSC
jgi:hypothetical protein